MAGLGVHGSAGSGQLKVCRVPARSNPAALIGGWRKARTGSLEEMAGAGRLSGGREVLPSCWRGVSCFPLGARVKLMSESLARTDRRHPPARAHARLGDGAPASAAQLSSAAGGLLRASELPGSPATSGPHPERARSKSAAPGSPRLASPLPRDRSMTSDGGLPWVGGCYRACGRCTSSCGRASPARSRRTFPSRVSGVAGARRWGVH